MAAGSRPVIAERTEPTETAGRPYDGAVRTKGVGGSERDSGVGVPGPDGEEPVDEPDDALTRLTWRIRTAR